MIIHPRNIWQDISPVIDVHRETIVTYPEWATNRGRICLYVIVEESEE